MNNNVVSIKSEVLPALKKCVLKYRSKDGEAIVLYVAVPEVTNLEVLEYLFMCYCQSIDNGQKALIVTYYGFKNYNNIFGQVYSLNFYNTASGNKSDKSCKQTVKTSQRIDLTWVQKLVKRFNE